MYPMARVDILPKRPHTIRVILGPGGRTIAPTPEPRSSTRDLSPPRGPIVSRFGRQISPRTPAPGALPSATEVPPATALELVQENERLRRENAQLRAELATLRPAPIPAATPGDPEPDPTRVRMSLLELE